MDRIFLTKMLTAMIIPMLLIAATGASCSPCGTNAGILFPDEAFIEQDLIVNEDGIVTISFVAEDFDPFLELFDDRLDPVTSDFDSGEGNDAMIQQALRAGTYRLFASREFGNEGGSYILSTSLNACLQPHVPGPNEVERSEILFLNSEQLWSFSLFEPSKVIVTVTADDFNCTVQILDDTFTAVTNESRDDLVVLSQELAAGAYFVRCAALQNESGAYDLSIFAPDVASVSVATTPSER